MRRLVLLASAFLFLASTVLAQTPAQGPLAGATVLTVSTQLVQVDVIVSDASGNMVHGLQSTDFRVSEDRKPQTIRHFEETSAIDPEKLREAPKIKLSPGIFTDYSPIPEKAPLTVLLLDRLNTRVEDQMYVVQQLRAFLRSTPPNSRTAIFGLTSHLIMLQGFTTDPEILRSIVETNGTQSSQILSRGGSSMAGAPSQAGAPNAAALAQFDAEEAAFETQSRIRLTLQGFDQLAAYLSSYPGRKNVVWFSGSFPLTVDADTSIKYEFNTEDNFADMFHKTVNLLARARVAIYPVEAGGLSLDTSRGGNGPLHNTMQQLAEDTGGKAFYGTNDLVGAVHASLTHGGEYYTLAYSPSSTGEREGYHTIKVGLSGDAASRGWKIDYRRGYYRVTDRKDRSLSEKNSNGAPVANPAVIAALKHGAPAPSEILFKVRVLPAEKGALSTASLNPGRKALPTASVDHFTVDISALTSNVDFAIQPDGNREGQMEFGMFVFDAQGHVLSQQVKSYRIGMETSKEGDLVPPKGLFCTFVIDAPKHSQSVRIAAHDLTSGRLGVVEVPLDAVRNLPPAPPAP